MGEERMSGIETDNKSAVTVAIVRPHEQVILVFAKTEKNQIAGIVLIPPSESL
jgi:hypothetical protein